MTASILAAIQVFFALVIGIYFWNLLKTQNHNKHAIERESRKELEKLRRLRSISLSEPLAERTRPAAIDDIIGQKDGIRALRAALCGPNPQHVIIYGPPGVGKTAAARVILEEAKRMPTSPFQSDAKFIELDATTARFDERGIADPLIGSVHDPIYQGAGAMGIAGIPQPKQGAVTKAHGGVLFIDEIGELHPIQMNKLLKVLEDRKVFLESAYYSSEDNNIPVHVHDIFQNGLPADFRLIGATTRSPEELPPALRSRCVEVFFRSLSRDEIDQVATGAARKLGMPLGEGVAEAITEYATNGRDAVNLVQVAGSVAMMEGRAEISIEDIEWVVQFSHLSPRPEKKIADKPQIGVVNGLAVYGPQSGILLEIEVTAAPAANGDGRLTITGLVEEETIGGRERSMKRKSMAKSSLENVLTTLHRLYGIRVEDYHIHVNFPGGMPVDGPSAGVAMAVAIYSAVRKQPVLNTIAMTGELSILGSVRPVGGVPAKVLAAVEAGAKIVLVPKANWQETFRQIEDIQVVPVERLEDVLKLSLVGALEEDTERFLGDIVANSINKPLSSAQ
ncbi:Sigma 54 interacting domain-containing protein [Alicyclobacillus hesperidum URH17-3-68]|uniref:endopeptidase La n=1 Tax=Alicyclobacillus hesperidum TaxID=89784 RepID=A0A1H2TBJ4_9BACL|nr:ATP-dependent protease LonB [Alicyclobacillus hesperidum]EJY55980.1 Sigma 54 interacting domain-containing protein [Alicyclobacillus hesperidum URH17-3-68]SDW40634.1 Lon-like ATP-dependent protease [Alicyclobacillus hesperidum]